MMKKQFLFFLVFIGISRLSLATDYIYEFIKGNELYERGQYVEAAELYRGILKAGKHSPELYYNLGNAEFKSGNLAEAIVAYERAHRLDPGNEDIQHNLVFAHARTVDKIPVEESFFLYEYIDIMASAMSAAKWAFVQIAFMLIALIFIAIYTFSKSQNTRKYSFYGALGLFGVSIFVFFLALHVHHKMNVAEGIVITDIADIKAEPSDQSTKLFNLHAGTKVKVQETNGAWYYIKLSGDKKGWIYSSKLELL